MFLGPRMGRAKLVVLAAAFVPDRPSPVHVSVRFPLHSQVVICVDGLLLCRRRPQPAR